MAKEKTNIYFASDFHLGAPDYQSSREREQRIVQWLDSIKDDAAEIFLIGDVFDFWFEFATVIPKGYIRLQGKLAEISDTGTQIYFFKGNHDMWIFDYFKKELGIKIIDDEFIMERNGKRFFLHHGDGLGAGDQAYKFLKGFFRSKFCQWLFARLHPNLGIGIANYWSGKSRIANSKREEKNRLVQEQVWANDMLEEVNALHGNFDYLIMGHRHFPVDLTLKDNTRYINLGEWVNYSNYAVFDGEKLRLEEFVV